MGRQRELVQIEIKVGDRIEIEITQIINVFCVLNDAKE